jgi:hypothetical protein
VYLEFIDFSSHFSPQTHTHTHFGIHRTNDVAKILNVCFKRVMKYNALGFWGFDVARMYKLEFYVVEIKKFVLTF